MESDHDDRWNRFEDWYIDHLPWSAFVFYAVSIALIITMYKLGSALI